MSSKAARRRQKKSSSITLAGGITVTARPTGRDRRHTNQQQEDARMTVARARLGCANATKAQLKAAMTDRSYSDPAHRCIRLLAQDDAEATHLSHIVDEYRAARRSYRLAIGVSDSPQSAAIAMLPTDLVIPDDPADIPPMDTRTPEQRERAATRRWMLWQGRVGLLDACDRALVVAVIMGEAAVMIDHARPMARGAAFIEAMRVLAARIDKAG